MSKKVSLLLCLFSIITCNAFAQDDSAAVEPEVIPAPQPDKRLARVREPHVVFNKAIDFPIIIPATVWDVYALPKIYDKPNIDSNIVKALKKEDIPAFDRWAVRYSDKADAISNIPFYAAMPYPLILLADKDIRHDAARVGGLYLEAMTLTGLLYTGGDYFIDRYRPETYDESKPLGDRMSGNEKNAFFAGHVALVSTSFFFTASIYDIYHPTSKLKWAFYGLATVATGATIYLRHVAGKHFPSDLLVGTIVGVSSGMLVPRLHRAKPGKKHAWFVSPSVGEGYGLTAVWRF